MTYDPESRNLAAYFLDPNKSEKKISELAEVIQEAVENWFQEDAMTRENLGEPR